MATARPLEILLTDPEQIAIGLNLTSPHLLIAATPLAEFRDERLRIPARCRIPSLRQVTAPQNLPTGSAA